MHCSNSSALYFDAIFIQVVYNLLVKFMGYFDERRHKCYVLNLVRPIPALEQRYRLLWFRLEKLIAI